MTGMLISLIIFQPHLLLVNMSGEPKQEYFSEGFTENIMTGISACPKSFLIARNVTFT